MLEQPTKEQAKEFWEGCGIKYEVDQDEFKVIFPDEQPWYNFGSDWKMGEIEPPIDLNNLFKYAVLIAIKILKGNDHEFFGWKRLLDEWLPYLDLDKDSALSLFWVLRETMKKK